RGYSAPLQSLLSFSRLGRRRPVPPTLGPSRPTSRLAVGNPVERAAGAPCRARRQATPLPAACRLQFVRPAAGPARQTGAAALNPPARSSSPATDCFAMPGAPELFQKTTR